MCASAFGRGISRVSGVCGTAFGKERHSFWKSLGFSSGETGGNVDPVLGTSASLTRNTVTENEGSPLLPTAP